MLKENKIYYILLFIFDNNDSKYVNISISSELFNRNKYKIVKKMRWFRIFVILKLEKMCHVGNAATI